MSDLAVNEPRPAGAPASPDSWADPALDLRPYLERRRQARRARRMRRHVSVGLCGFAIAGASVLGVASALTTSADDVVSLQLPGPDPAAVATVWPALGEIPSTYVRLYRQAGREYGLDWRMLAAVGEIESASGRSSERGVSAGASPAGAVGPAQFLPQTWARYGVDADGSGTADPFDPADAITTMAAYLKASGAPEDWPAALYAYNHSAGYVSAVLALSRRFDAGA